MCLIVDIIINEASNIMVGYFSNGTDIAHSPNRKHAAFASKYGMEQLNNKQLNK